MVRWYTVSMSPEPNIDDLITRAKELGAVVMVDYNGWDEIVGVQVFGLRGMTRDPLTPAVAALQLCLALWLQ